MPPQLCECSIIIPTRNRRSILADTLTRLEALSDDNFEIIVCDNGSTDDTLDLQSQFPDVRWIALGENLACAARNSGAAVANGWLLLMLDDDSWPDDRVITRLLVVFRERLDLGAASLRVRLTQSPQQHDAGGTAGTFFNCGAAMRRVAFLEAGCYPTDYEYYVEEYDLSCKLWQSGWRIEPLGDLLIRHGRVTRNRDNNNMIRLLVRNNLRLWRRFAPASLRDAVIDATLDRYLRIAEKENGMDGYNAGLREARKEAAMSESDVSPLTQSQFDSLMGLDIARAEIADWADKHCAKNVAIWSRGKSCDLLLPLLKNAGIRVAAVYDEMARPEVWHDIALRPYQDFKPNEVDGLVVGSLSCGVAEDMAAVLREKFGDLPILCPVSYSPRAKTHARAFA